MNWITTYTGRRLDLLEPDPADIDIRDIAHSLSLLCRFTGHVREFYSVAQHSVLVSRLCPPELRLQGLLHDAHEAYIGDLSSPMKACLLPGARGEFRQMELDLIACISEALGVDLSCNPVIKHFDRVMLREEAELLLPTSIDGWEELPDDPVPPIRPWSPMKAEEIFLQTYRSLTEAVVAPRKVFELVAA